MRIICTTSHPNKFIVALLKHLRTNNDETIGEAEDSIYLFIEEQKKDYKRNNPQNLSVLRSRNELMVAYSNNLKLISQIECFFYNNDLHHDSNNGKV